MQRTEDDIDVILSAVKDVWMRNPGMNLVQTILNIAEADGDNMNKKISYDPRYVSDLAWIAKSTRYPYL